MKYNILLISAFCVLVSGVVVSSVHSIMPARHPAGHMFYCKDNQCQPPAKDKNKLKDTLSMCSRDKKNCDKPKPCCNCGSCR
jgi:hypothetical protein